jgi:ATP-binding cassette, subfamily B, bacterial MsbA
MQNPSLNSAKPQQSLLQRFLHALSYFKQPRSAWIAMVLAVVCGALLEPTIPALLKPLLDNGFNAKDIPIWKVPAAILGLFLLRSVASFISSVALAKIVQFSLRKLRTDMFAKVSHAQLNLYQDQPSSALANTIVFEATNGAVLLLQSLTTIVKDSLSFLALLGYLLYLNWKLTLIIVCIFPIVALSMRFLSKRLYRLTKQSQTTIDQLAYVVEENVLAHKEIRIQGAQAQQAQRFDQANTLLEKISMKSAVAGSAFTPVTHIFGALALSIVITIALVQSQTSSLSAGGFVAFITAMLMLIAPLKHLSEITSTVTRGIVAAERAVALVEDIQEERGGTHQQIKAQGKIEYKNIHVHYKNAETAALQDINLEIHPGQFIAFVGLSGSGKTTLANLLPRFVDYSAGDIYLDGVELRDWDIHSLRQQFAMVGQNVIMFNDTVANNIALGHDIDRQRVLDCMKAAYLDAVVERLPQGLDTMLGHNASLLSGGERQRLAIARALYKDAPVLLLDEATSALDSDTDSLVQAALRKAMQGRTTIAIAHRLNTIKDADHIVVLSQGRIIQTGTHAALESTSGAYRDFIAQHNAA